MSPLPRRFLRVLPLALAAGLIALLTLEPRPRQAPLSAATPWSCLVCGGLGTVDVLLNLALFVPLGFGLFRVGFGPLRAAFGGLLVSSVVELLQATVVPGRDSSLSDLVTNTAGAFLGALLARALPRLLRPPERAARHLAIAAGSGWIGLLAFTAWAIQPAPPARTAVVRAAPAVPHLERFAGRVTSLRLDGAPALGPTSAPALARALEARSVRLDATATLRTWPEELALIADVVDSRWNPTLQLGQVGQKIIFSVRTRSELLRLRAPSAKVYRALPEPRGQAFDAGGALTPHALSAWAIVGGAEHRAETRLTPGL